MFDNINDSPAGSVYLTCLIFIILHLLFMIVVDYTLWAQGKDTVSMWLRAHPTWFFAPFLTVMFGLSVLVWHLWGKNR